AMYTGLSTLIVGVTSASAKPAFSTSSAGSAPRATITLAHRRRARRLRVMGRTSCAAGLQPSGAKGWLQIGAAFAFSHIAQAFPRDRFRIGRVVEHLHRNPSRIAGFPQRPEDGDEVD